MRDQIHFEPYIYRASRRKRMKLLAGLFIGVAVVAAAAPLPVGTWTLASQTALEGNAPSFPQGITMRRDNASSVVQFDQTMPSTVANHDRMRFTESADGRTLTQETKGIDAKTGKPYRYVLIWRKASN